jgi:hypothetical protein
MEWLFPMPILCSFTSSGRLARSGPLFGALRGPWGAPDPFRLLRWHQQPLDGGAKGPSSAPASIRRAAGRRGSNHDGATRSPGLRPCRAAGRIIPLRF